MAAACLLPPPSRAQTFSLLLEGSFEQADAAHNLVLLVSLHDEDWARRQALY
jgi:hypothetical protein